METMKHVLDPAAAAALSDWLAQHGHPIYRAGQILQWIYRQRASAWDDMTNLPKSLRAELAADFRIWTTRVANHRSARDGTEKLLLELDDGGRVECVLLPGKQQRTVCISTQVGCAMGCVFCASGLDGVDRNLSSGEILEQMLQLQQLLPDNQRISHVVVMGMGEPLANLDQLLPALDEARQPDRLGIGTRRITISTVGLPSGIRRLAQHATHYPLAISLHAPTDTLRNRLVPINRNITLRRVFEAADAYFDTCGRRLTYEYVLLAGINDQPHHAQQLATLLQSRAAMLNVIPYNPVAGLPYRVPSASAISDFRQALEQAGINVQLRQRKGDRIDAACGQLRRRNA